jgi:Ubiquitin fusion degradation protein UFD1
MNDIDSFLRIEISKVYPIENYSGYMKCYKYSDKIVLPLSICYSIIGPRNQFSVIFSIHSKSNYSISALCGVLEFTAEKDAVYCPSYILKKIGFTSLNKCKEGVILEILSLSKNKHLFPKLTQLKVCSSIYIQENTCKRGLLGYTTIKTGDILTVLYN